MNTSTVVEESTAQQPQKESHTRPEPSVVTVGVVLFQWNEDIRKRVQTLGKKLGQAGVKLQLLTHTDIQQCDKKTDSLDGVVFQIIASPEQAEKHRFDSIIRNHQQQVFGSHAVIAAFITGMPVPDDIEAAIDLSMKAHSRRCEWLGMVNVEPEDAQFHRWCKGIAMRVRHRVKGKTVLAA